MFLSTLLRTVGILGSSAQDSDSDSDDQEKQPQISTNEILLAALKRAVDVYTYNSGVEEAQHDETPAPQPVPTNAILLSALMRAMDMYETSRRAQEVAEQEETTAAADHPSPPRSDLMTQLRPQHYRSMIDNLSLPDGSELYLPSALAMLARTQPIVSANVETIEDPDTQTATLIMALQDELDHAEHLELVNQSADMDWSTYRNSEYSAQSSPSAGRSLPDPESEHTQTKYCGICMEDTSIEDIFCVGGCDHTYCRTCIHPYIKSRIDQQDVTPRCPHGDCDVVLSDGDLTLVLTLEEQEEYYRKCQDLAVASVPGLFQCLQDDCRGIGALAADDPHFVCPLCRAERCVQCNTRQWHEGLTCEQLRQRERDNELHPEQLRQIYGNSSVYQCGSCAFGPIERAYCSDLATHHGERVGNAVINNCCPRCGWFANDISQWPAWNGQLHPSVAT